MQRRDLRFLLYTNRRTAIERRGNRFSRRSSLLFAGGFAIRTLRLDDMPGRVCECSQGRTRPRLRRPAEYGPHPKGFCGIWTSIPNNPASVFDWSRESASIFEMLPTCRCGRVSSGPCRGQTPVGEDNRDRCAAAIHGRTSRSKMSTCVEELQANTSGTVRVRRFPSEAGNERHVRRAWFAAYSWRQTAESSLRSKTAWT